MRAAPLPGGGDPTGELGDVPDALADSEQTPAPPAGRAAKIEFIGSAGEYARLWYVNRILSLLTLGIYSAWAKVRQRQYLASHTLIDGVPLVYEGPRGVTADTALRLARFFGGDAQTWLNLQTQFDLGNGLHRLDTEDSILLEGAAPRPPQFGKKGQTQ